MKFFKVLLWKAYFDKGFSFLNYLKYGIAFFGLASQDVQTTLIIAGIFGVLCLIFGRLWFYFKLIETENEIQNIFNPFCQEVREGLKDRKI